MENKILTAREVAKFFGVNIQRVYELCRTDPSFPHIRIGERQYRFSLDALERWVQSGGSNSGGDVRDRN